MSSSLIIIIALSMLALYAVLIVVRMFNALETLRNRITKAYAQIDVQLKHRYDLIPNLVETAKGYLKHERDALEAVIEARNAAATANTSAATHPGDPSAMHVLASREITLGGTLGRLFAISESYSDFKANTTMLRLMNDLALTEEKISYFRQEFNDAVMAYNTKREVFPSNAIAETFRFNVAGLFAIKKPEERLEPKASFG